MQEDEVVFEGNLYFYKIDLKKKNKLMNITWQEKCFKERGSFIVGWRSATGFIRLNKHSQKSNNSNQLST